jgi:hypothetical protein
MQPTISLNLNNIKSEFENYDSRKFIREENRSNIFDMAVFPTYKYYLDKVSLLNSKQDSDTTKIDKSKVLTIKAAHQSLFAKLFSIHRSERI